SDIVRMMELFPVLHARRHQAAGHLSGGQQQMLALARALMAHPRLLLLDEPSMGLSPMLVREVYQAIAELKRQGTTILLVEQNAHAALAVADRAYVIETGAVVLSGTGADLLNDERVRTAYLGL
ncbi:MAG: ATP-binding cassette domain-containing protein, partial [Rhodospirillaceae bacterium]